MSVYKAINAVQAALAKEGISKGRKNQQQGYSFRGVDDIMNVLSSLLAEHQLCILPRIISRECVERTTAKGGLLFYSVVMAEFDLVSAIDGSKHTIATVGEAMDSADKSSNKAMSAAYKYACLQAFCIPTEGDNDADAHSHELIAATSPAPSATTSAQPPKPLSPEQVKADIKACTDLNNLTGIKNYVLSQPYTEFDLRDLKLALSNRHTELKAIPA